MRRINYNTVIKRIRKNKPFFFKLVYHNVYFKRFPMKRMYRFFHKERIEFLDINECNSIWKQECLDYSPKGVASHFKHMLYSKDYEYYVYYDEGEFEREWALELLTD